MSDRDERELERLADGGDVAARAKLARARARASGMQVVPIPGVATVPAKVPWFDHEWFEPGAGRVLFAADAEKPAWRGNLARRLGAPGSCALYWYGVSVVPDATSDPRDVLEVWDRTTLSWGVEGRTRGEWPMREVMGEQPRVDYQALEDSQLKAFEEAGVDAPPLGSSRALRLRSEGAVRDVTISQRPIELGVVDLSGRSSPRPWFVVQGEPAHERRVGLMLVLYGIDFARIGG